MTDFVYQPGAHRFAVFTACCTLLLLVAGALVTSNDAGLAVPDWPLSYGSVLPPMVGGIFWEHGHRMVATLVGILTIILAIWLHRHDTRPWMRKLGWVALAMVIAQGILGGLTVLFYLPRPVSISHAGLAQLFFCTTVSLAFFTSRWWASELPQWEDREWTQVRLLAALTFGAIFVQLILGAAFRHQAIGILPHIVWAFVVAGMAGWTTRAVQQRTGAAGFLRAAARSLSALVGMQILLGAATFWAVWTTREDPQPMPVMVVSTVAHLALGALTMAASVLVALGCFRVTRPAVLVTSGVARLNAAQESWR